MAFINFLIRLAKWFRVSIDWSGPLTDDDPLAEPLHQPNYQPSLWD